MTKTVRPARPEDAELLTPLLGELGYPATPEAVRSRLYRLLANGSDRVLVAEREKRLAGFLCLHTLSAIHDDDPLGWITALVVASNVRGAGIGRALVEHAAALAREVGCRRLIVATHLRRGGAHGFMTVSALTSPAGGTCWRSAELSSRLRDRGQSGASVPFRRRCWPAKAAPPRVRRPAWPAAFG